ncbi:MAG: exonuclease SbcCD subunit D [Dehalococcoidia bacterium]|nr:exonuclease SbcCD subunit D [Dehalococcoidia bacterium]
MKIVHFADLHLGVEAYGSINSESGISSRLNDFLASFDKMVDFAAQEKVDLVLFCGDAYKSRSPSQTQQREFAKRIKRLSDNRVAVLLLAGNHDMPNAAERATTTEIFDTLGIPGVQVALKPQLCRIPTPSGDIQVIALPWLRRSAVAVREDMRGLDFNQINEKMSQILTSIIGDLTAKLDPSIPSVLATHAWVQGARTSSESSMSIGNEHTLLVSSIAHSVFDYVALGHIHRHQVLNEHPPVVYSGSLERLDFGDENDEKGFYLVEIDCRDQKRNTTFTFQSVPGRRFFSIKATVSADDLAPTESVLKRLQAAAGDISGNIVRLELTIPQECIGRVDEPRLRQVVQSQLKASYFDISRSIIREARPRLGDVSVETLTPTQALETYLRLKSDNYSSATIAKLAEMGKDIIREVDGALRLDTSV